MRLCLFCAIVLFAGVVNAQDEPFAGARRPNQPLSAEQAIQFVGEPAFGFGNMSPFELQVHYRLMGLLYQAKYKYDERHAAPWRTCMLDDKQPMYARLCAAYFLLDKSREARGFVESQVASTNLRYRYNAAKLVEMYVGRDSSKAWGVDLLIRLLSDGSIDGSGVKSSPRGDYPDRDRDDIMATPIDEICWHLGFMKERRAVTALISVLQRRPKIGGAAFALGEIGDDRAIPILMTILKERSGREHREVTAIGRLKAKQAVPILISRLGHPKTTDGGIDTEDILEALLEIGDKRAIAPIEDFLKGDFSRESKAAARCVLSQLASPDPVKPLLALLETETYEPERSKIITALTKYRDDRVVEELAVIARTSDSAFMRREAILALRQIGNRQSLLVLASLLDETFPKDLEAEWGWKFRPDFRTYFPETIVMCLNQCTKQDFGKDRAKWEEWIGRHVGRDIPEDSGKPRR